ncbi:N utilization substance A domain protein [Orientia tsutsugamushi str. UT76]|nr:N utilization substance A domain protein [Orientia tsutsugamushi str. UT76]
MFLSRTDNQMLVKLLEMEVPEIYEGTIIIKAVARDQDQELKLRFFHLIHPLMLLDHV